MACVAAAIGGGALTSPARAENWTAWRGPRGNGTSTETRLPLVWSDSRGIAWRVELPGTGTSTPVVWDDAIFVTAQDEERLLLVRVHKPDGSLVWVREVGSGTAQRGGLSRSAQKFHELHNLASPSPVTDGEVVIVHFGNGDLAACDFDGRLLWKRNLQQDHGPYSIWWGHANSPVLFDKLVVSVCMQDSLQGVSNSPAESYVVAHNKRSGELVWKTLRATGADAEEGDAYTTPVLAQGLEGWELIVMGANQLDAYDPLGGEQLWVLPGLVGGRTVTGPIVGGDMVYATRGMKGDLVAVRLGGRGELTRREIVWKQSDSTPDTPCPVLWDALLFTVSDLGVARCYDAETGHVRWRERLGGDFKASPLAAEGRIYFTNREGVTTVVAADDRYRKLAENRLDEEVTASLAVSGGKILLRGRANLVCLSQ